MKAVTIAGPLAGYEHSHFKYLTIAWVEAKDNRAALVLMGSNKVSKEDAKKPNIVLDGEIIKYSEMIHFYQFDLYLKAGFIHRDKKKMALIDRRDGKGLYAENGLFIPALVEAEKWARKCIKDGKVYTNSLLGLNDFNYRVSRQFNTLEEGVISRCGEYDVCGGE